MKWVLALDEYDRVIKVVAPKKEKLALAEAELIVQMAKLNEKRQQLKQVYFKCILYCIVHLSTVTKNLHGHNA